jgi:hypothetical protein
VRTAAKAGVRWRFAPHQLRHAHAVEMAHEGVPLVVIQRQLGHVHLGVTSVYLQGIDSAEIIDAVHSRPEPVISAPPGSQRRSRPIQRRAAGGAARLAIRAQCRSLDQSGEMLVARAAQVPLIELKHVLPGQTARARSCILVGFGRAAIATAGGTDRRNDGVGGARGRGARVRLDRRPAAR